MRDLRSTYRESLRGHVEALRHVIGAFERDVDEAVAEARRIAHVLEGTGAGYGFPELSDRASAVLSADIAGVRDAVVALEKAAFDVASGHEREPTVLLVEDDPLMRELLTRVFTHRGLLVEATDSIGGAMNVLSGTEEVAVIVLDLFLPDGDGRDLIRVVRSERRLRDLPLIAMSGSGTDRIRRRLIDEGADGFYQKPFDPNQMADMVERLADDGRPEPVPDAAIPTESRGGGKGTVLVVDDDRITSALLIDRLRRDGYDVEHRADGASALRAAADSTFHAAILDVNMPQMNGFELLGHLRRLRHWQHVPIIMLTATGNEHDVVRGFQLGADDYVLKPFSPAEMSARLHRAMRRGPDPAAYRPPVEVGGAGP